VAAVLDSLPGARSSSLRLAAIALLDSSGRRRIGQSPGATLGAVLPSQRAPAEPTTIGAASHSPADGDGSGVGEPILGPAEGAVTVTCFGGFRIAIGGRPIGLDELRPRARSLLRLLAVSAPDAVHRERLVEAFWPDADLAAGTRRLQVAISSIRRLLQDAGVQGEIIVRNGDAYRLSLPPDSTIDVSAFETALRDASWAATRGDVVTAVAARRRALALYGGHLLPEEGPADYLTATRDRLRIAAAAAAAAAAHESRRLGELGEAIAAARRSVDLDPFQDSAWDMLAALHTDAGDHLAATQARREHSRAIAEMERVDA
jgi:DNA-binding SARP family transcriptional activator